MIRKNTWIAIGGFVVVLAAALLLSRAPDEPVAGETTPTPEPLWSVSSADIVGLVVENLQSGETIELARDAEQLWTIVSPQPGGADAARVERAVSWLAAPMPRAELQDISDLGAFQLSEPSYRVELRLQDGTLLGFNVGREAPTGGSQYVSISGREGVWVVSSIGLQDVLNLQPDLLPTPEPTATPTETEVPVEGTATP